uniref:Tyrosine specific protein phosphatases domain-containing protein n=1 Tax=Acrobeloides nanus TaxID=290746 RepID=A0A914DED8_9BILA
MIVQEECEFILMLCNVEENGVPKCASYWPTRLGQKLRYDRFDIMNIKVEQPPHNTTAVLVRGSKRPIAIHSAAGIERTGSSLPSNTSSGALPSSEDMVEIVKGLLRQRIFSIQNNVQYLYVDRVLLYFIDKYKAVAQSPKMQRLYKQFKRDYNQ